MVDEKHDEGGNFTRNGKLSHKAKGSIRWKWEVKEPAGSISKQKMEQERNIVDTEDHGKNDRVKELRYHAGPSSRVILKARQLL